MLSEEEERVLEQIVGPPTQIAAGTDFVREGSRPTNSTLLVEGFAARYKIVENGSRQITALHTPGDFVDLHSLLLKTMDHGVLAITPCKVALAPHAALRDLSATHPHLSRLLWLMTLIDGAIHREWLVFMGRTPAVAHAAHLLCEIYAQLDVVGLAPERRFDFPITQSDLGDVLGLSSVHVNRVLQELRAKGLIRWENHEVTILDWDSLKAQGQFDPTYLHMVREPR